MQSAHVLTEAILKYKKEALEWHRESNIIVMLDVADELELFAVLCELEEKNIKHAYFREEDFGNELTAIAILPSEEAKVFTKKFKLAKLQSMVPPSLISKTPRQTLGDAGETPAGGANAPEARLEERSSLKGQVLGRYQAGALDEEAQRILHENRWELYD